MKKRIFFNNLSKKDRKKGPPFLKKKLEDANHVFIFIWPYIKCVFFIWCPIFFLCYVHNIQANLDVDFQRLLYWGSHPLAADSKANNESACL